MVTGLIDIGVVRDRVPPDLEIMQVRPGRTVAAIMLADYRRPRATLPYAELAIMPALVRYRGVRGPWISDIWVNSRASLEGGRQMWGLYKEAADFAWDDAGSPASVRVTAAGRALGSWSWMPPGRRFPFPARLTGVGSVDGDRRSHRGRGVGWLWPTPVSLDTPDGSPLAEVHRALQRPVWMVGALNVRFGDIRILRPPPG